MIAFCYRRCTGRILIRNLDDSVIDTLKRRAAAGRSMEAEAREALTKGSVMTLDEKLAMLRDIRAHDEPLRAPRRPLVDSWISIREGRDDDDR